MVDNLFKKHNRKKKRKKAVPFKKGKKQTLLKGVVETHKKENRF